MATENFGCPFIHEAIFHSHVFMFVVNIAEKIVVAVQNSTKV